MSEFLQRLKERKLVQWAIAYAASAFALLQGIDIVAQEFGWPEGARRGVTLALVVGFFVTLVLAWYHGERGAQRVSGTELLIIGLVLALGGGFLWRFSAVSPAPSNKVWTVPNEDRTSRPSVDIPEKSIAVLPFENLSDDRNAAYFADGVQDEILTKLSSIADLKVIARTSTAKYKRKPEDLRTVSQQLGVAKVLEGSVQKAADKVRVNVQLIDARADSHLWAKTYDRDLADVFAIQSEVAQEIADSLQAKLSPAEAQTMARPPTKDPAAYDLFLKGDYEQRLALSSLKPESFDQAATWYRQAIARDSDFALAMARLVESQMLRHWFIESFTEAELAATKEWADRALTLEPNLAQAHVALGIYYYYAHRQYEQALGEYARAVQLQPNNADAIAFLGYAHRRQGQLERALEELTKALEQDPRDASLAGNLAECYFNSTGLSRTTLAVRLSRCRTAKVDCSTCRRSLSGSAGLFSLPPWHYPSWEGWRPTSIAIILPDGSLTTGSAPRRLDYRSRFLRSWPVGQSRAGYSGSVWAACPSRTFGFLFSTRSAPNNSSWPTATSSPS
jgi:TolB-like protein/Tfp pilus assembly protein PilF